MAGIEKQDDVFLGDWTKERLKLAYFHMECSHHPRKKAHKPKARQNEDERKMVLPAPLERAPYDQVMVSTLVRHQTKDQSHSILKLSL